MIFVFGYLNKQSQQFRDSLQPFVTEVVATGWVADFHNLNVQSLLADKINQTVVYQPDITSRMRAAERIPDGFDPKNETPCCDPPPKP